MEWKSNVDGGIAVNIFDIQKNKWWEHMDRIMENINLAEVSIIRNNCMTFKFLNSYNGAFYKCLECNQILKCCIDNDAMNNESFAYFIADIYAKELSKEEVERALKYYKYRYEFNSSLSNKVYLVLMIGNDICIDILCKTFKITT